MAEGAALLRLSEGDLERDPAAAVQKLTVALKEQPDNSGYYCQRASAHILLQNYHDAVTDAKDALALDPSNATAFLRQGIGEYHMENYRAAMRSFTEGQKLNSADETFTVWIKRCEEAFNRKLQAEVLEDSKALQHQSQTPKFKHDWYQTESHVIVTIMIKNAKKEDVSVQFSEKELSVLVRVSPEEDYRLKLHLLHSIVPEQSTSRVLSTKIEIKLKKPEAVRWEQLEGDGGSPKLKHFSSDAMQYPSSSHYTRNWDKLVGEIKEEEKNEKLEGDAALNKLFQQIYSDGTDEVRRAMNKSFMESGGTVLSTNWSDVGKRKVDVNPPDDMEWKKF
ncbi:protein SGT1 homolog [Heteronotia binoei]|uniref:protein SGT1 homolog n=1 Tax=Heteronotia binoei TaxID=13085 RepID=UPI002931ABF0|nr:protein SGT1 homolog [Heteronotia binoei]